MSRSWHVFTFTAESPPFPEAVAVTERIEAGVFRATFGESAENLRSYYADHLAQTVFVLVREGDAADTGWAGMMRLGLPGPRPSLSLEDAVAPPFSVPPVPGADRPLDILTAAVRSRFRRRGLAEVLLAAAVAVAREHGCSLLVAMVDHRVIGFAARHGIPHTVHSGLHPYYGSSATGLLSLPLGETAAWLRRPRAA